MTKVALDFVERGQKPCIYSNETSARKPLSDAAYTTAYTTTVTIYTSLASLSGCLTALSK